MCSAFFSHEIFHIYTCFRKLLLSSLPYIIPSLWNWVCPWPFTLKPAKEDVKGEEKREEEMSFKEIRQCCFKKTCSVYCILWLRGRHDMWMHTEIGWGKQSSPKEKRGSPCRGNTRLSQSKAALNDQLQPGSECPPEPSVYWRDPTGPGESLGLLAVLAVTSLCSARLSL